MSRFRPINEQEIAIFRRMLHPGVENREGLLRQLDGAQIELLDNDDSLVIANAEHPTGVLHSVAEAEFIDSDGITVSLCALVDAADCLIEIDICKADGSRIKKMLQPEGIDVFWPAEPGKKGWWEE